MQRILEAKDLKIYKRLLRVLGEYTQTFPSTGIGDFFDSVVEQGKKVLPKDKQALTILYYILKDESESVPTTINKLLNMRFPSLPVEYRPITLDGRKKEVAFWQRGNVISDRVKDLIDFKNVGKIGGWCNVNGDKVSLVDMSKEDNNE